MIAEKDQIKGNRKLNMPINGVEIRAIEAAASHLDGPRALGPRDRRRVAAHLVRLGARYRLRDRVS